MSLRIRHISACLALIALIGGGLVAPALHHASHGLEHAHEVAAAAAQTDHVHTDGVGFTVSLDGLGLGEPCLQYVSPHTAPPLLATPVFVTAVPVPAQARPMGPATVVLALLPIRGPPAVA
jgi:hypothetical protein